MLPELTRAQKMGMNAGAMVREMSKLVSGGGGGKLGIAQGGMFMKN